MRAHLKIGALLATLFCAGVVAAWGGGIAVGQAAGTLTLSTVSISTAEQQTTVQTVTTTETQTETQTQTRTVPTSIVVTTTADTSSGTQTWALIAIGGAILALIALIGWLATRHKELPAAARRQLLAEAVGAWVAQGWAPVSQTDTTAVLQRGGEHTVIAVDAQGNISSQAVGPRQNGAG